MSDAWISMLAALGGTFVGAFSTFASTTLTQYVQARHAQRTAEHARRQEIYGRFLEELAAMVTKAMEADRVEYSKLGAMFALEGRMCLFAPPEVVAAADGAIRFAIDLYDGPTMSTEEARALLNAPEKDWIKIVAQAARRDLDRFS